MMWKEGVESFWGN